MSRLQPVDPATLKPEGRAVYDKIANSPRGGVRGPFLALLHVPEMCDRIQHLGAYLRYDTSFDARLSEMAILIVARRFNCPYEWFAHEPHAQKGGLAQPLIEAIRERRRPDNMKADEIALYDFASELVTNNSISDTTYQRALDAFDKRGVVELAGLIGYYMMIAITLVAHDLQPPAGTPPLFK
jgi:4-carboxymuconolactone decarboxylase